MRTTALLCLLLSGCAAVLQPDPGRLYADAAFGDAGPAMQGEDAGPGGAPDAWGQPDGCASLSLGTNTLAVTSSECDGPLMTAETFTANVRDTGTTCIVTGRLRVLCDHMYREFALGGSLMRTGTVYTSEPVNVGCEGVDYTCQLSLNSVSNERRIDCMLGASMCSIHLERP